MSKAAKFFIICGIVCVVGLGLTIGGFAAGGLKGLDKVAEKYDWMEGSPGNMQVETIEATEDFTSIEQDGNVDLVLIGDDMLGNADAFMPKAVAKVLEETNITPGTAIVAWGENVNEPYVRTEEGVLKITGKDTDGQVQLNFTPEEVTPTVVVYCGDMELENLAIDNTYGDVGILGVCAKAANINSESGEIYTEMFTTEALTVYGETADMELSGTFKGVTVIENVDGDVEIDTVLNQNEYGLKLQALSGDIEINDGDIEIDDVPAKYEASGGPNQLNIKTGSGDIDITFGLLTSATFC